MLNLPRQPDFANLLAVLRREVPARPTLFEFFMNPTIYAQLGGEPSWASDDPHAALKQMAMGFANAGYDYATCGVPGFEFAAGEHAQQATRSINDGGVISDRATFERYCWPDPDCADYTVFREVGKLLPPGMKLIAHGPCGVLENVIRLVGYENLCFMIIDDEQLATDIFAAVGSRLVRYYQNCVAAPEVGAAIGNDDWGFKTQTMLAPADMRRFVFPWHKRIVAAVHAAGKPAILHSCGKFDEVIDDIVDDMQYDARHSYEDAILPVEDAYEKYHQRIAIVGGIDLDYICRSTPAQVRARSAAMLARAAERGGYALGSGNSIPEYVPVEAYLAMISAALTA